jgi:hypothetical protein
VVVEAVEMALEGPQMLVVVRFFMQLFNNAYFEVLRICTLR